VYFEPADVLCVPDASMHFAKLMNFKPLTYFEPDMQASVLSIYPMDAGCQARVFRAGSHALGIAL